MCRIDTCQAFLEVKCDGKIDITGFCLLCRGDEPSVCKETARTSTIPPDEAFSSGVDNVFIMEFPLPTFEYEWT